MPTTIENTARCQFCHRAMVYMGKLLGADYYVCDCEWMRRHQWLLLDNPERVVLQLVPKHDNEPNKT